MRVQCSQGDHAEVMVITSLQVLARAFVSDDPQAKLQSDAEHALKALDTELAGELEVDVDQDASEDVVDSSQQNAFGYRRLCAACGLMRLARRHDSLLSVQTYFKLALTMQVAYSPSEALWEWNLLSFVRNLVDAVEGDITDVIEATKLTRLLKTKECMQFQQRTQLCEPKSWKRVCSFTTINLIPLTSLLDRPFRFSMKTIMLPATRESCLDRRERLTKQITIRNPQSHSCI